ncbi:pentapeptide repeat-containing protein [Eshraghiella crossota]|uniref:pentapeptide repeat-containing protein n=1 Tax=Eshraghiella crossota TaxID=45851 RepID=UPI003AEF8823
MKGFKVFNSDWTCRGFQFEVGKTFTEDVTPVCCDRGFHFCTKAADCFKYYSFDPDNKVAEVEALGDIDTNNDDSKCSTNKIHIIREITWQEVLDLVNLGKACTGLCNSGDWNSGNRNSGDWNSGDCNSGDWNSGNRNSGDWNSGNRNSGDCNSGDWNSGDCNSGDWNKTCFSNGCFNTELPEIFLFNKPSDWTYQDWLNSDARYILMDCPSNVLSWIWEDDMTDEEKEQHPEYSVTGGFLKHIEKETGRQMWWDGLSDRKKDIVMQLPNFDKDIFKEITGITVEG